MSHLSGSCPEWDSALSGGRLPRLRLFDLSVNRLGRRGVTAVVHACRHPGPHPRLCRLNLYVNGLSHSDLEEISAEVWKLGTADRITKAVRV